MSKARRLRIGITLILTVSLITVVFLSPSPGIAWGTGPEALPLPAYDLSAIPQSVADDAVTLATELFQDCQQESQDFVNQLLAMYSEAEDKDFVTVFNPGGWGWNPLKNTPGWQSIITGIKSKLDELGYKFVLLECLRTDNSWLGRLSEIKAMIFGYPSKAKDLAYSVNFLTSHIPDLKVIIAGESTGTLISNKAMAILEDDSQVYSIQTGPPFWYKNVMLDRTLVLVDNGIMPDSLSHGDFLAIFGSKLKALFGSSQPEEFFGTPPHYVGAPGHDYWWQYPRVYSQIADFINKNLGVNW